VQTVVCVVGVSLCCIISLCTNDPVHNCSILCFCIFPGIEMAKTQNGGSILCFEDFNSRNKIAILCIGSVSLSSRNGENHAVHRMGLFLILWIDNLSSRNGLSLVS
jgi:hypothetical protein